MPSSLWLLILLASAMAASYGVRADDEPLDCAPVQQLRIYEVPKENIGVFHERFRDHAVRIMKRHGFEILAMWQSAHDGATEFLYLLTWRDLATMKSHWADFMADDEWAAIKRETSAKHGTFVNHIEDRVLCKTDYSPKGVSHHDSRNLAAIQPVDLLAMISSTP